MDSNSQDEERSRHYPIQEHMFWQRVEWRIQHIGYFFLFTIVILGACGLFSKGILSKGVATSKEGALQVQYERFGLLDSDMVMTVRVKPQHGDRFTLSISGEEMENFQIQSLQPQPQQATSTKNSLELSWASPRFRDGATVWIGAQAQNPGRFPVTITLDNATSVHFTQWIYP
ncbi:hypothetical protein [Pantoea sp. CCBC3-3-1]|uniref:hypothetical protein n=1 Tax=Pantoea sp. CCBC3-3-1 TaxID=2490851 RepID=UPI0011BE569E|nr:hypothetical protein [Pantoea sp. CCBC3-3-1]